MELPLFGKEKDYRLVRPKRIAVLEWLRALRHNLHCEFILLSDQARSKAREQATLFKKWQGEILTSTDSSRWLAWKQHLSGRKAAEYCRQAFERLRQGGIGTSFWPFIFMVGLLAGIGMKYLAEDTLTIGYDDYTLSSSQTLYDLNDLQDRFETRALLETESSLRKTYPACNIQEP